MILNIFSISGIAYIILIGGIACKITIKSWKAPSKSYPWWAPEAVVILHVISFVLGYLAGT